MIRALVRRFLAWLRPRPVALSTGTGPYLMGGSVRAELQWPDGTVVDLGPVRSWVIEAGAEIRGSSDRAIVDHLCGTATWEGR